jgi:hypothetical protein
MELKRGQILKVANQIEGGQGRKFGRLGHVAKKRRRSKTLTRGGSKVAKVANSPSAIALAGIK